MYYHRARLPHRCSLAKAFISYSRKDKAFVHALAEALRQKDVTVWADWNDLRPAVRWQDAINTGIDAADNFVVVLSADWTVSDACHEELKQAVAGRNMTPFEWKLYFGAAKYRHTCPNLPDGKEER